MENFNNSIDERNKVFLDSLAMGGVNIDFVVDSAFKYWAVTCNSNYTICAPNTITSHESLTHELLHIILEKLGSLPMKELVKILRPDNCRFNTKSLLHMNNHLCHCKMVGIYVDAGYKAETFLANYGNLHLVELLAEVGALKIRFENERNNNTRYSIDLITDLIDLCILVKYLEIQNFFSETIILPHNALFDELIKTDSVLFNSIDNALTNWSTSKSHCNYDFYLSLNLALEKLGYPVEQDWPEWETGKKILISNI